MKTNHLFSALLSLALICPGIAQETHYQRPPAVIEEVALAKLSPIIRISDNNQWAHPKKLKNTGQKTGLKSVPQTGNLVSRSILMS